MATAVYDDVAMLDPRRERGQFNERGDAVLGDPKSLVRIHFPALLSGERERSLAGTRGSSRSSSCSSSCSSRPAHVKGLRELLQRQGSSPFVSGSLRISQDLSVYIRIFQDLSVSLRTSQDLSGSLSHAHCLHVRRRSEKVKKTPASALHLMRRALFSSLLACSGAGQLG